MNHKNITICYFGIYKPTAPRDKVYLDGLKELGVKVVECVDSSTGLRKFFNLIRKHRQVKNQYDVLWVGYLSAWAVPLARLLTGKKIVFNALGPMYETFVLDRGIYKPGSLMAGIVWFFDFLSFRLADIVLVESEAQKKYIMTKFKAKNSKLKVIYTGADDEVFFPDQSVKKREKFTALFRGMFLPATGVEYAIEAAKILKDKDVDFLVIGWGQLLNEVKKMIKDYDLNNVTLIDYFLEPDELREKMLSCHVMLGQFAAHERMDRTIQNKTFEALALGMPYITRDSESNGELLEDGKNCLFVKPADPDDLAEKILELKNDSKLRDRLSKEARILYGNELIPAVLGEKVLNIIKKQLI